MAIQFACPSCQRPIEVDDEVAGSKAACPYCQSVVTAPASSEYGPPPTVPTARVPDQEVVFGGPEIARRRQPRNAAAIWGFGLACVCWVVFVAGWVISVNSMPEEWLEQASHGEMIRPGADGAAFGSDSELPPGLVLGSLMVLLSLGVWFVALVCVVVGLRRRHQRGFAWAGVGLLSVMGFFWLLVVVTLVVGGAGMSVSFCFAGA
jgi:hypothetical protein